MKKIASAVLAGCMLVTTAVCTGAVTSAEGTTRTATISVYDYCGAKFNPDEKTHPNLIGKGTKRADYTFEVGDLVNVTVAYKSVSGSNVSAVTGATFINQKYKIPESETSFREYTDGECDILSLSDSYYTQQKDSKGNPKYDKYTYFNCNLSNVLSGANPEDCNPNNTETVYSRDKIGYMFATANADGVAVKSTKTFTFTVRVDKAGSCFLYTAIEDAVEPKELSDITEDIKSITSMTKVGHEEIPEEPDDGTHKIRIYSDSKTKYRTLTWNHGECVTIQPKAIEGKYLSYWSSKPDGSDVLCTLDKYTFMVSKDTSIYAIYVDREEDRMPKQPTLAITGAYAKAEDGKNNIYYEATRNIPATGYSLKEHGVIYGRDKATFQSNPDTALVLGGNKVSKCISTTKALWKTDSLVYNMGTNVNGVLWARGYMVVKNDQTGETKTYYSDVVSYTFNSLL